LFDNSVHSFFTMNSSRNKGIVLLLYRSFLRQGIKLQKELYRGEQFLVLETELVPFKKFMSKQFQQLFPTINPIESSGNQISFQEESSSLLPSQGNKISYFTRLISKVDIKTSSNIFQRMDSLIINEIRKSFRENITVSRAKKMDILLDDAFDTLRKLSLKVSSLENQQYQSQSEATTMRICVKVASCFYQQHSTRKRFTFGYSVTIENNNTEEKPSTVETTMDSKSAETLQELEHFTKTQQHSPKKEDKTTSSSSLPRVSSVQLLRRHWIIRDSNGSVNEVKGDGVVGNQPVLKPGERHNYVSHTVINTPIGTMEGYFTMMDLDSGEQFDVRISPFGLLVPKLLVRTRPGFSAY